MYIGPITTKTKERAAIQTKTLNIFLKIFLFDITISILINIITIITEKYINIGIKK